MSSFLRDWVKDIFIVVTGLCFVELILPEGSMRKYLKWVFSLLILGVVIAPLAKISGVESRELTESLLEEYIAESGKLIGSADEYEDSNRRQIEYGDRNAYDYRNAYGCQNEYDGQNAGNSSKPNIFESTIANKNAGSSAKNFNSWSRDSSGSTSEEEWSERRETAGDDAEEAWTISGGNGNAGVEGRQNGETYPDREIPRSEDPIFDGANYQNRENNSGRENHQNMENDPDREIHQDGENDQDGDDVQNWESRLEGIQWKQIEDVYTEKLKNHILSILEGKLPEGHLSDLRIYLDETAGENAFGKVKLIVIKAAEDEYLSSIREWICEDLAIAPEKIHVEAEKDEETDG